MAWNSPPPPSLHCSGFKNGHRMKQETKRYHSEVHFPTLVILLFFFFLSLILTPESCKHFLVKMHLSIENITSYQIKLGLLNSSLLYNDRCFSKQLVPSQKVWKTQPQPFVFSSMTWIDNRLLWKLSDVFTCTHKSHILNKFKRFNLLLSFRMNWKINKETNLISGINFLLNLSQFSH